MHRGWLVGQVGKFRGPGPGRRTREELGPARILPGTPGLAKSVRPLFVDEGLISDVASQDVS